MLQKKTYCCLDTEEKNKKDRAWKEGSRQGSITWDVNNRDTRCLYSPSVQGTNPSTAGLWKNSRDWEEKMPGGSEGPHRFLSLSSSLPANKHPHYSHCHPSMEPKVGVKPRITSQHGLLYQQEMRTATRAYWCAIAPPSIPPAYLHLAHYSNRQVNADLIPNISFFTAILNDLE